MKIREAAILVGGLGTRLRAVLPDRPKGLALVGGKYILAHILDALILRGIERTVLCTGHLGEQVSAAFGVRYGSMELAYSREASPMGTAGALAAAEHLFNAKDLLVLNGDSYSDFNLEGLISMHESREAVATAVLAHVDNPGRYGAVETNAEGAVVAWHEKGRGDLREGWINAGVYLINFDVVRIIRESGARSLERELFPSLIGKGMFALRHPGSFIDIGTPQSLSEGDIFFRILSSSGQ